MPACRVALARKKKITHTRPFVRLRVLLSATMFLMWRLGFASVPTRTPLRDDPTLDEPTRLRNRIAELESLVRELRGAYY